MDCAWFAAIYCVFNYFDDALIAISNSYLQTIAVAINYVQKYKTAYYVSYMRQTY